ncbi:MAG: hypothetical protein RLZZ612_682 [Pseudomonadota bacterium]
MSTSAVHSSLQLDERRLGMLELMGVAYRWPATSTPSASPPEVVSPAAPTAVAVAAPVASHLPPTPLPKVTVTAPRPTPTFEAHPRPEVATLGWEELESAVQSCRACGLCTHRRQAVLGMGPRRAKWMIVGEGPGEQEDKQGLPFVGPAGQLLDAMLAAMGLSRDTDVYITNAVKCRPPSNRNPEPQEWMQCQPYLMRQIELVQPDLILSLGRYASHTLLDHTMPEAAKLPLGRLRGHVHQWHQIPVIVSYHPAYLLRNPTEKAKVWQDLCSAMSQINHNPLSNLVKKDI